MTQPIATTLRSLLCPLIIAYALAKNGQVSFSSRTLDLPLLDAARRTVARGDTDHNGMLSEAEFGHEFETSEEFREAVFDALDKSPDDLLNSGPSVALERTITWESLTLGDPMDVGSEHGELYKGTDPQDGQDVVVKFLDPAKEQGAQRESEIATRLSKLKHDNLILTHASGIVPEGDHKGKVYFIMEKLIPFCPKPPKGGKKSVWTGEAKAGAFVKGVLSGLQAMHEHDIAHMDLKPSNIMTTASGTPKIIDFGMSIQGTQFPAPPSYGTSGYQAPEWTGTLDARKADVYAAGAVLWALLAGKAMHEKGCKDDLRSVRNIHEKGVDWAINELPDASADAKEALRAMLHPYPLSRKSAAEVLKLGFFTSK